MNATQSLNKERRKQAEMLIDELLKERHQVWALYCRVAELKPFSANDQVKSKLNEFSQLLIDYVSLGHFGIYQRILDGKERRNDMLEAAEEMYPDFFETTEAAVSFNDKYDHTENGGWIENLEQDLSSLGENLAKRIDIEDQLCRIISH